MNAHQLMVSDCLEFLKTIESDSIDLIINDPPYNISYAASWDKWRSEESYLLWCAEWATECARVLKPGRMMLTWGTLKTDTFLRFKLDVLNKIPGLVSQNEIIWSYNWGGRSKANFARKHELIWAFSKGEEFLFNGDDVRIERKQKMNPRTNEPYENGTVPTCVWEQNNHTMSKEHVSWHPTQKPLALLGRAIKAYSNPGETVLDCFSGSGSTMMACELTGRSFKGCDSNASYVEQSHQRFRDYFRQGEE